MTIEKIKCQCYWCGKVDGDFYVGHIALCPPIESMESLKEIYGGKNWREWFERDDLTKDDHANLDKLSFYDQMLNTIEKGVLCLECLENEDELLEKYGY